MTFRVEDEHGDALASNEASCAARCGDALELAASVDTTTLRNGLQVFRVTATDLVGNSVTQVIAFQLSRASAQVLPELQLSTPLTAADAVALARAQGVEPVQLTADLPQLDEGLHLDYELPSDLADADVQAAWAEVTGGLLDDLAKQGLDFGSVATPLVDRMTVEGEAGAEPTAMFLRYAPGVKRVRLRVLPGSKPAARTPQAVIGDGGGSSCDGPWWPSSGRIDVAPSYNAGDPRDKNRLTRYVYQSFRWSAANLANLVCHHEKPAYEHEAQFAHGINDPHYLGNRHAGSATNLPDDYLDTQFRDKVQDLAMGSSHAEHLRADKTYYTMIRRERGLGQCVGAGGAVACEKEKMASSDHVIVVLQRSYRQWLPHKCGAWCVQGDARKLPFDYFQDVPASYSWRIVGDPENPPNDPHENDQVITVNVTTENAGGIFGGQTWVSWSSHANVGGIAFCRAIFDNGMSTFDMGDGGGPQLWLTRPGHVTVRCWGNLDGVGDDTARIY
jgi:hypothetical protein